MQVSGRKGVTVATVLVVGAVSGARVAQAHAFAFTDVLAILKSDGTYQVDMRLDVDALALGVSPSTDSALVAGELRALDPADLEDCAKRAKDTLRRRVRVRFDGVKQDPVVSFPQRGTPLAETPARPSVLGTIARFEGAIPNGAETFVFGASRAFQVVHLTIFDQAGLGAVNYVVDPGASSPEFHLGQAPKAESALAVVQRYVLLGFEHILPRGVDHILFVLGLFLLSTKWRPLLWQITAFTVAHTASLALSMAGIISLPSRPVETLIALSIAYVAIENLFTTELKPWRPAMVFLFGLLHGLGFAGALRKLGLPSGEFVPALVSFNAGVELGQVTVVLAAFALVGWLRKKWFYRRVVVIPASLLIAATGLYWSVERAMLGA